MNRESRAKPPSPFRYFNSSPEVIRLVVLMYIGDVAIRLESGVVVRGSRRYRDNLERRFGRTRD